jgi:hypothetical protein
MAQQTSGPIRHKVQGLLFDGLQILREELPSDWVDPAQITALDECIERLTPMPGLGVSDTKARLYALTHALRVLTEDLAPHSKHELLDFRSFPGTLTEIEDAIEARP